MVGSAIVRQLTAANATEDKTATASGLAVTPSVIATEAKPTIVTRTHAELELTNQAAVNDFFAQEKPTQVYLAAAKVGGIHANNTHIAEFI